MDSKRLESLLRVYCEKIVPHYVRAYTADNVRSTRRQNMQHQIALPTYAIGRPDVVAKKLWQRWQRGSDTAMVVQPLGDASSSRFLVQKSPDTLTLMLRDRIRCNLVPHGTTLPAFTHQLSPLDRHYIVDIKAGTCSCPDCRLNKMVCKHMFAIFHHSTTSPSPLPQPWRFEDLPASLVGRPSMIIDADVVPPERLERREGIMLPPWLQQLVGEESSEEASEESTEGPEASEEEEVMEEEPSPSAPRQRSPTSGDMEDKLHKIRGLYHSGDEDQRRELMASLDDIYKQHRPPMDDWSPPPPPFSSPNPPPPCLPHRRCSHHHHPPVPPLTQLCH